MPPSADDYDATLRVLRHRFDKLQATVRALRTTIREIETLKASQEHPPAFPPPPPLPPFPPPPREPSLRDLAYDLLVAEGGPLTPATVVTRLRDQGVALTANNPPEAMRSMFRRDARFCQMDPPGTWGLVEWETYEPPDDDPSRDPEEGPVGK